MKKFALGLFDRKIVGVNVLWVHVPIRIEYRMTLQVPEESFQKLQCLVKSARVRISPFSLNLGRYRNALLFERMPIWKKLVSEELDVDDVDSVSVLLDSPASRKVVAGVEDGGHFVQISDILPCRPSICKFHKTAGVTSRTQVQNMCPTSRKINASASVLHANVCSSSLESRKYSAVHVGPEDRRVCCLQNLHQRR